MRRMLGRRWTLGLSMVVVSGSACGWQNDSPFGADTFSRDPTGSDTRAPPADVETSPDSGDPELEVRWMPAQVDPYLGLLVGTPSAPQRFTARLEIEARRAEVIDGVTRMGADGAPEAVPTGPCEADEAASCASVAARAVHPGELLAVRVRTTRDDQTKEVRVPTGTDFHHHAIALAQTSDGTIWTGTAYDGLVGLTRAGSSVRYAGVDTREPWDPQAHGPQSGLVLAIEPVRGGASSRVAPDDPGPSEPLWIGSATTGVSYFDPGQDPIAAGDDLWIHGTPAISAVGTAVELAETPIVLRAARAGDGVWVGTLNGLFHVARDGFALRWTHLAEGPVLAFAEGSDGLLWVGSTTEVAPASRVGGWSVRGGALIAVDPDDGVATEYLEDTSAVLAILPRAPVAPGDGDDTLWLGTPRGLYRFHPASDAGLPVTERMNAPVGLRDELAVVQLAADGDAAFWIAARSECVSGDGQLIRVALGEDGEIAWATDYSDAGFSEQGFNVVRVLAGGDIAVSTLVPRLRFFNPSEMVSGDAPCLEPTSDPTATADTYLLTPTSGALARRLGE